MMEIITTGLGMLPLRPAVETDAPALTELLQTTQRWLEQQHIPQWVPAAHEPLLIKTMIEMGGAYVAEYNDQVIALCRLLDLFPAYWTRDPQTTSYLSTLTVAREFAGYGIGEALLGWAESTLRQREKRWACLDCYASNSTLCAYYERQGYVAIGEFEPYPGYVERMYEKRLTASS
jgi:ribosomal protein S18 acetylase RimI-like enzyme